MKLRMNFRNSGYLFLIVVWLVSTANLAQEAQLPPPLSFPLLDFNFNIEAPLRCPNDVNIYATQNAAGQPLGTLKAGQLVWSTRNENGWVRVFDKNSGETGWAPTQSLFFAASNDQLNQLNQATLESGRVLDAEEASLDQKIASANKAIEKFKEFGLGNSPWVTLEYRKLYYTLVQSNKMEQAEKIARLEFKVLMDSLGPNDMRTVFAKQRLAGSLVDQKMRGTQEKLLDECLEVTRTLAGENSLPYLEMLFAVANAKIDSEARTKALQACADIALKIYGDNHAACFYLTSYADAATFAGEEESAAKAVKHAIQIYASSNLPNKKLSLAHCRMLLGNAQSGLSQWEPAIKNLQIAIAVFQNDSENPESQVNLGRSLVWLGNIYSRRRNYPAAIEKYEIASRIFAASKHAWQIDALTSLASAKSSLGMLGEAETICKKAIKIAIELGRQDLANSPRHQLGMVLQSEGKLEEGKELLKETVDSAIKSVGKANALNSLHNYADLLAAMGEDSEALAIHLDNYAIRHEKYGDHHNCTQSSLLAIGGIYLKMRKFAEAKKNLLVALKAQQERGNSDFEGG